MLERTDLFVFPDVNPDGKIYSQTNDDPNLLQMMKAFGGVRIEILQCTEHR